MRSFFVEFVKDDIMSLEEVNILLMNLPHMKGRNDDNNKRR